MFCGIYRLLEQIVGHEDQINFGPNKETGTKCHWQEILVHWHFRGAWRAHITKMYQALAHIIMLRLVSCAYI